MQKRRYELIIYSCFFGFAKQAACMTQIGDASSRTATVKIANIKVVQGEPCEHAQEANATLIVRFEFQMLSAPSYKMEHIRRSIFSVAYSFERNIFIIFEEINCCGDLINI